MDSRYRLNDASRLLSPSLVIFRSVLESNLEAMVRLAGGPTRLRPHVKTHKMAEIVRLTERLGVHQHKCATIAEAEMIARAGGRDVLLAYPIVGPNIARLAQLIRAFPETQFRILVDHPDSARALSNGLEGLDRPVSVLIDLEVGMGRTGIEPGPAAEELAALVDQLPNLTLDGLHAYDGHIHDVDLAARRQSAAPGVEKTLELQDRIRRRGIAAPLLVLGGTPTFPVHATLDRPGVQCSPGTSTLHDHGYASRYPDLPFTPAALLLTRVISHPRRGRICLDLGHKAVAADPVGARLTLPELPEATLVGQSEEHLVVDTPRAADFPPGAHLLAVPTHICPTCALHRRVYVVADGELVDEWDVTARDRSIGI